MAYSGAVFFHDLSMSQLCGLKFFDGDASHHVGFQSPDTITSNTMWKLPNADSSGTQCLVSDGSGNLSWSSFITSAAVSSVFGRSGAVSAQTNDYTWAQINKATSSIADITTRSAADLNTGTLPSGRIAGSYTGITAVGTIATGVWQGTVVASGYGGTGQPTYDKGEILHGTAGGSLARLGIGSAGQVLTVSGGDVAWAAAGGGDVDSVFGRTGAVVAVAGDYGVDKGGTGQTTFTNGQLLIGNTTGNTLAKATLTQGTGIVITNGTGSITIAVDTQTGWTAPSCAEQRSGMVCGSVGTLEEHSKVITAIIVDLIDAGIFSA